MKASNEAVIGQTGSSPVLHQLSLTLNRTRSRGGCCASDELIGRAFGEECQTPVEQTGRTSVESALVMVRR